MAALVLGAITQASDRTPWLAAILADRFGNRSLVFAAAAVALALNYGVGVAAGVAITAFIIPEAKLLLLALALVLAGLGTGWRAKAPDRLSGWRIGPLVTSVAGLSILAFGDRMQFVVAALAGRSALPWAAAVGATLGALAVTGVAVALGEKGWLVLPLRAIQLVSAGVLTVAGLVVGVVALRLV